MKDLERDSRSVIFFKVAALEGLMESEESVTGHDRKGDLSHIMLKM